jgi:hypothetical protein
MKTFVPVFLLSISFLSDRAEDVVVPADRATQAGNSFLGGPFTAQGTVNQVYGSKIFLGPVLINGIAFRMDETSPSGSMEAIIPRVTVRMSTYFGTIDTYRPGGYDQNKGVDDTTTFDAPVHWITSESGMPPNSFDLKLQFSTPFYYDPSKGDLIMNFTTAGLFGSSIRADYHGHGDPTIGWTVSGVVPANLVTQFDVTSVPEPAFGWLFALGTLALISVRVKCQ